MSIVTLFGLALFGVGFYGVVISAVLHDPRMTSAFALMAGVGGLLISLGRRND